MLTRLQYQVDEKWHPRSNIAVSQALGQRLEAARQEDSTREHHQDLIRLCVQPPFGSMTTAEVDVELLEHSYVRLRSCKQLCGGERHAVHCSVDYLRRHART